MAGLIIIGAFTIIAGLIVLYIIRQSKTSKKGEL